MRTYEQRAGLYKWIWEYKRRMGKEGVKPGRMADMQEMIKKWEKMMEEIDKGTNIIRAIGNAVAYRTGYNVKESYHNRMPGMREALGFFYKYGLDSGITGQRLLEYTGTKGSHVPGNFRSWMVSTEENKEAYHRFKDYMEELIETIDKGE